MITYPTASVFPPLPLGGTPLSELQKEVIALKQAKDALILAHNYQCEDAVSYTHLTLPTKRMFRSAGTRLTILEALPLVTMTSHSAFTAALQLM